MKSTRLFILALVIVFSACKKKNTVRITERNFDKEVQVTGNLSFKFNKDLIPGSIVNLWLEDEFLKIKPSTEGKYMWVSPAKLVFQPAKGFIPSTDYTCELTNKIFKYAPDYSLAGDKSFYFHTPYLEITEIKAYWTIPDEGAGEPLLRFDIVFNQDVKTNEVADLLNVELDKESKDFRLITDGINNSVSVVLTDIKAEDRDISAKVTIDKGLTAERGSVETKKPFVQEFDIASPFKLNITDVQANHDGMEGVINISTSQPVNEENIKDFIRISPWVKYTVEILPGSFIIKSEDFDINSKYELTIKEGLEGKVGGKLKYEYNQPVSFGELKPDIFFVDKKEFYVSGKGSRNIEVAIINVQKVNIKITKIYENNILKYIQNYRFREYDDDYYYDDYYYYYDRPDAGQLGDIVYEKEIETNELQKYGSSRLLKLDFEDKLSEHNGIYSLEVRSTDNYWLRAEKLISVSDIGLIVKEGKNSITVFANSLITAQPISDAGIAFIGSNNQITYTAKTNTEGVATYEFSELKAPGFKTSLVTANYQGDYNFIPFRNTRISVSRFDIGGKRENPAGMEAFIYGDRDIYRPGETVNISAIIRDYEWNMPGQIPVIMKITTPQGKMLKKSKKILNDHGSFEMNFDLTSSAVTGSYTAALYTTNDVLLGSGIIRVEEFVPDRIKVDVGLDKDEYKPGDNIKVNLQATNFFGPPAANRNYEIEMSVKRKYFSPKENKDYNYTITGAETYFAKQFKDDRTDEEGKAVESFNIPSSYKNMGILQSDFFITVFDETGRPVNNLKNVNILTQDVFYGIRYSGYYIKTGEPVKIDLIAVDKNGKALSDIDAEIQLIKHEYKTVLSRSGNYFRYRSEKIEKILDKKIIKLNETSTFYSFIPDLSGRYELRVSAPGVYTYVSKSIYAYGWGRTSYTSFKVNNEGQIDIQLDKDIYKAGDKARVILKAPFSGRILVTLENNKVQDYFYIETDKRAASFELDLKQNYIPNIYITATLFRPHKKSDLPLTVAHGFAPVMVEDPANKLPVEIKAVQKSRSNTKQKIKVKSKPDCALTIAVVDEGILQITGYRTPDPYNFFYQKRSLEVNSYDIYPYLFPEVGTIKSHTGGGGPGLEKRVNPLKSERIKLVTFWSGIIQTNSRGEAEYEIDIPQFSGDLRIMAVTYKNKSFGSGAANMKVADPLVISTALPRFFSPKDSVEVPVILTNTTAKSISCKTQIKVNGPVKVTGRSSETVNINSNSEKEVLFKVYAEPQTGEAKVIITADALGEKFINTTDITVRPASPLQKRSGSGVINAGETRNLDMNVEDFIESSIDNKLIVSNNPLVRFTTSLDYLVRYPYGCIEQTVSTAFPQLYFTDLINIVFREERAKSDVTNNVQYALDRIRLMQLYNGGLTFWPGGGSETWWGSVYAAHFAVEAKKAGYDVDEEFLKKLLQYLKIKLKKKETITYYYNRTERRQIAPKEVPYSLYVLAMAGEKQMSTMNYYKARTDQLSLDGKYLLAAAYALAGDTKKYKEVLPGAFKDERSNPSFGGSFYSYVRDEAIALNTLLEIDPDNPQTGTMARHISDYLLKKRYLNTQERAFGFLAMGKIARIAADSDVSATIKSNGKNVGQCNNNTVTLNTEELKGTRIEIVTQGDGKLYYFWEAEGISVSGKYLEEDNFIKVRKRFYDRNGNSVTRRTFKQNDLILVELFIENGTNQRIENVVISDILPGGFEIENPRLTVLPPGMKWPNSRSYPDYQDIRDDRINLFVDLYSYSNNRPQYYYYMVRAVSRGTFQMGPVGADAMYNSEYHSYHGGGIIKVMK
jgi:uncharacterized protein YfaS (alpha-2-macroglobulin family)